MKQQFPSDEVSPFCQKEPARKISREAIVLTVVMVSIVFGALILAPTMSNFLSKSPSKSDSNSFMVNKNPYKNNWHIGGTQDDIGQGIAIDSEGNKIITGVTHSTDFPIVNGYNSTFGGHVDAFVAKFAPDGTLLWSTYLGGAQWDEATGIAVDSQNNIIVTGSTFSQDFPATIRIGSNQIVNAFVVKFSPSGSLIWSATLGGSDCEEALGITLDSQENIIITGVTHSDDFPIQNAYDSKMNWSDAFVTKLSPNCTLLWSTLLGGNEHETGQSVAVDNHDNIFVTGSTWLSTDFPTRNALDSTPNGGSDAFIAKFAVNGSLEWSTYFGGKRSDYTKDISTDAQGNVYISGSTSSPNLPIINGYDSTYNGGPGDGFVAKISATGSLLWSTYLGGDLRDYATAGAVDGQGNYVVVGSTWADDFPTWNAYNSTRIGGMDVYVTKFATNGSVLWSSYFGCWDEDEAWDVVIDSEGAIHITGWTSMPPVYNRTVPPDWDGSAGAFVWTIVDPSLVQPPQSHVLETKTSPSFEWIVALLVMIITTVVIKRIRKPGV